jgi:hypothetical protein
MLKALNDGIIIVCKVRRWLPLNYWGCRGEALHAEGPLCHTPFRERGNEASIRVPQDVQITRIVTI